MVDTTDLDLNEVVKVSRACGYQYYLVELIGRKENKKIVLVFSTMETQYSVGKTFSSDSLIEEIQKSERTSLRLFKELGGIRAITIRRPLKSRINGVLETLKKDNDNYTVTKSEPLLVTEEEA